MRLTLNEWTVSGELYYLKELDGEFAASLKIRGVAQREGVFSSNILELPCLMQKRVYEEAKRKGVKQYKNVTITGHIESWAKRDGDKEARRIMLIADSVLEVA